jgi:hypothetical protein
MPSERLLDYCVDSPYIAAHRATTSSSRATFKFRLFLGPSSYVTEVFIEWEMGQKVVVEEIETYIIFSNFLQKLCRLWDNIEKIWYTQTRRRRQYNTAHARCMLNKQVYRHTFRIWDVYFVSTVNMFTWLCLNATFIHTLPLLFL